MQASISRASTRVCEIVGEVAKRPVAPNKPIVGSHLFEVESGIVVQALEQMRTSALGEIGISPFPAELVGREPFVIVPGRGTGRHSVRALLEELEIEATDEQTDEITERVKQLALVLKNGLSADLFAGVVDEVLAGHRPLSAPDSAMTWFDSSAIDQRGRRESNPLKEPSGVQASLIFHLPRRSRIAPSWSRDAGRTRSTGSRSGSRPSGSPLSDVLEAVGDRDQSVPLAAPDAGVAWELAVALTGLLDDRPRDPPGFLSPRPGGPVAPFRGVRAGPRHDHPVLVAERGCSREGVARRELRRSRAARSERLRIRLAAVMPGRRPVSRPAESQEGERTRFTDDVSEAQQMTPKPRADERLSGSARGIPSLPARAESFYLRVQRAQRSGRTRGIATALAWLHVPVEPVGT